MKILSLFLLLTITSVNLLIAQSDIQTLVKQFENDPDLTHASISFKAIDISSNEVIASINSSTTLPTASTAKLFSTATALEILGPNHRPITRIYYDGVIDSAGVLNGNIWIRGGADPTFGSKYFTNENSKKLIFNNWIGAISSLGIKKIEGNIIGDASEFGYKGNPDGWNWVDLGNYYGAGPSGLTIYDNLLSIHFKTSSIPGKVTEITHIEPVIPDVSMHNYVVSSNRSGDNAYIYGAPYSMNRFATGELPLNQSDFIVKGSVPDPEFLFAHEFSLALNNNGILIQGETKTARQMNIYSEEANYKTRELIYIHEGAKLIDIITFTNMKSINLFAEHLINLIAHEKGNKGDTDTGLEVLENYWINKIDLEGAHINDGSGLSRTNAISADNYISLLAYMDKSSNSEAYRESLPVAGISGTLRNVCKEGAAKNRLYAKSGTMNRIKSYAGYIDSASGKKIAFAIIVNNQSCSSKALTRKMERIFNKLATL